MFLIENRVPPHNLDAEQSVLAGCLLFEDMARDAVGMLQPRHFYKPAHSKIFHTIYKLVARNEPVTLVTVTDALRSSESRVEGLCGAAYLSELLTYPIPPNLEYYAGMIKDAATLREAIRLCSSVVAKCYQPTDNPIEIVSALQNESLNLGLSTEDRIVTMRDLSIASYERYGALRAKDQSPVIRTGFVAVDKLTGGFRGSKLIIIAARPGIGKTAFMCNMVENIAKKGIKIGVFELEMDKEELDDRWNASLANINTVRLTGSEQLNQSEWESLMRVADEKGQWPVWIDDTGGMTVEDLARRARKMKHQGCDIIFIDQLSFIRGDKRKSVFESNTETVESLGRLKKELRIPIVLLAQINRGADQNPGKKPTLANLKNTGMLEEAADMVFLGFRRYPYTKLPEDEHHAEWELAKNRGGPTGNVEMVWFPKRARFENMVEA